MGNEFPKLWSNRQSDMVPYTSRSPVRQSPEPRERDVVDGEWREVRDGSFPVSRQNSAIVVYADPTYRGESVRIRRKSGYESETQAYANVVERRRPGETVFVAFFPEVPPDTYCVIGLRYFMPESVVTTYPGRVSEVDWRK